MHPFKLHTPVSTEGTVSQTLTDLVVQVGFVPNVFAIMGGAPATLSGFAAINQSFADCSLSALEREVIHTATSVENQCIYCVAGHTAFATMQGFDMAVIEAVRENRPIADVRLEALRMFVKRMVEKKGRLTKAELAEFQDAGYSNDQVIEVILGMSVKFFSNLTSNLTQLPLDAAFEPFAWVRPEQRKTAA